MWFQGKKLPKDQLKGDLESINGAMITITAKGGIQGKNEEAQISATIECNNGIIHIIDKVLTPKEAK
jgi:uncharacterized surface protein with fasciclin (FAS1) repeats